jgi:uncharacterized membrane protein YjgN (DUF898 family)
MNKSGVRSAVRVIRLDAFDPARADAEPPGRGEPEPDWSTLPSMNWPDPIGSVRVRAPAGVVVDHPDPVVMPLAPAVEARVEALRAEPDATAPMPRLPRGVVTSWPVRFRGDEAEYVRLWFASLLRVLLTAGLYWPWAKVRSQHYMMRHTRVAGHALDYHEAPATLLPRYVLSLCLVVGVAGAWAGSVLAGMLATSLALAVWPLLVFMSLHQRLTQVSWARRRLAFDGLFQDVYKALWAPLAGGGALTWLLMAAVILHRPAAWVACGAVLGLWLLCMPVFVWSWFQFRQRHVRLGPLSMMWKATRPEVLMLFVRTLVWTILTSLFSLGVASVALAGLLVMQGHVGWTVTRGLVALSLLAVCAAVQPYLQARLQNLVWNKTGNRYVRIRSKLPVAPFVQMQCRHALLLALTLGLYWPWAAVATRRMRTHALTIWSRVDVEILKANWPAHRPPRHIRHKGAQAAKMAGSPARPRG